MFDDLKLIKLMEFFNKEENKEEILIPYFQLVSPGVKALTLRLLMVDMTEKPMNKSFFAFQLAEHLPFEESAAIIKDFISQLFVCSISTMGTTQYETKYYLDHTFKTTLVSYINKSRKHRWIHEEIVDDAESIVNKVSIESYYARGIKLIDQIVNYLIMPKKRSEIDLDDHILRFLVKVDFINMEEKRNNPTHTYTNQSVTASGVNFVMNSFSFKVRFILTKFSIIFDTPNEKIKYFKMFMSLLNSLYNKRNYLISFNSSDLKMIKLFENLGCIVHYERKRIKGEQDRDYYFINKKLLDNLYVSDDKKDSEKFMKIEMTGNVICYKTDQVTEDVLKLFLKLEVKLPDQSLYKLNRVSINKALGLGIHFDYVEQFLTHHSSTPIPNNLYNYMALWKLESHKWNFKEVLYFEISKLETRKKVINYLKTNNAWNYAEYDLDLICVDKDWYTTHKESLNEFIRK